MSTVLDPTHSYSSARDPIVDALIAAPPVNALIERLTRLRALSGPKPGGYALLETAAAARPALLAAMHRRLGGTMLAVVPTADVAERAFADLLVLSRRSRARYDGASAFARRSDRRDREPVGAQRAHDAAGRSSDGRPRIVFAPIGAVRQYVMPRALFDELRFTLRSGDEPGWEEIQQRLHRLGYTRADVVSAAGEYAVRGGIVDVFAATAPSAVRIEFFGDTIESHALLRTRVAAQQPSRSTAVDIAPWSEIPRDASVRERMLERFDGPAAVREVR